MKFGETNNTQAGLYPACFKLQPPSCLENPPWIDVWILLEIRWITATSHDRFPPNGGLVREIPLFHRLVKYYKLARLVSLLEGNDSKKMCIYISIYIYIHSFHLSGFNNSIYNDCMGPLWRYPKPAKKHPFSHLSLPIFRLTTAFKRGKAWIGTMIQNLGVVWSDHFCLVCFGYYQLKYSFYNW